MFKVRKLNCAVVLFVLFRPNLSQQRKVNAAFKLKSAVTEKGKFTILNVVFIEG